MFQDSSMMFLQFKSENINFKYLIKHPMKTIMEIFTVLRCSKIIRLFSRNFNTVYSMILGQTSFFLVLHKIIISDRKEYFRILTPRQSRGTSESHWL